MNLILQLFPEDKANHLQVLYNDSETQHLIAREIGRELLKSDSIIATCSFDQLMCLMASADFKHTKEESILVAGIIRDYVKEEKVVWNCSKIERIFPLISRYYGEKSVAVGEESNRILDRDIAGRCLIYLGLFYKHLQSLYERRAAPKPEFYRETGISKFNNLSLHDIAGNFVRWEGFLSELN